MNILNSFSSILNKHRNSLAKPLMALDNAIGLPPIRGKWFYVDPKEGSNSYSGDSIDNAVADINTAYGLCTSNAGDGIVVLSSDADTTANTTSYQSYPLVWAKNSITVIGICAPTKMYQRARISNVVHTITASTIAIPTIHTITDSASGFLTAGFAVGDVLRINDAGNFNDTTGHIITAVTAGTITCAASTLVVKDATACGETTINSYCTDLLSVTGHNNIFVNLHLTHLGADALELTCLKVSGNRNYFGNVHAGMGLGSAATQATRSLWLNAGQDNTFDGCTFGFDTVDRGNNATYDILLQGTGARNTFVNCQTIRMTSTGVACFAVYLNGTTGGRPTIFDNCRFTCWSTAAGNTVMTAAFGATGNNDDVWLTGNSCHPGYGSTGLGGYVWVQGANVAAGVGGVLTTQA